MRGSTGPNPGSARSRNSKRRRRQAHMPPSSVSHARAVANAMECSPPTASVTICIKAYAPQAMSCAFRK